MTRLKVGIIGAGGMANRFHLPSLASFEDVQLAAVCDPVLPAATAAAERFGIPRVFSDYRQMFSEVDPDAVYILVPPQHNFEAVAHALRQRKHVFVEKPPALTVAQTEALAWHAAEAKTCTMVGFQRRYIPALAALKRRVEDRGPIQQVSIVYWKATPDPSQPAWFYDGAIDLLTSDGIHAVDNLRFLAGGDVVKVASVARSNLVPGPFPNAFHAVVTFSTGAVGALQFSYTTGRRIFRAEFHGRNITASVDADRDCYIVADDAQPEAAASSSFGQPDRPETWLGFWHESRHFIDCIQQGRQPSSSLADAVKTMRLVSQIRDSSIDRM